MIQTKKPKIGSQVEVYANQSVYRGELVGMSETEIYIKTTTRTWALPLERVSRVIVAEPKQSSFQALKK